jgi:CHAT domain-containing protein
VTRDTVRVLELPGPGSPLAEAIPTFNAAIRGSDEAERAQYPPERLAVPERTLGREILAGVTDLVAQASRIFVSPDGFLAAAPFSMLIAEDGGDVLIADRDVVQIPSASVLVHGRTNDAARRVDEPNVVAIRARESRLSGARDEVRDLARHYAGVRVVDGVTDVKAFQQAALHCDVLHISSHALVVDRSPWMSGLRLATAAANPVDTVVAGSDARAHGASSILSSADSLLIERTFRPDPYLRAWQIAPLHLPAKLTVLSACETAGGRATTGEGTLGLTAAFLSAGSPVVVASLWPVSDRATATVMKSFYRHLADGKPVATALRMAQVEISRSSRYSHPFYWAGFTVVGDGSMVVDMKENPARRYALLATLAAVLGVIAVLITRTRRRRPQMG